MKTYKETIARGVLDSAYMVHKAVGPGLLESVYESCLVKELRDRGFNVKNQVEIPIHYMGEKIENEYRIDLLVNNEIIIELKAVESLLPVHEAQLMSYLRIANKKLGFLINFNVPLIKDGIRRYVNNYL